MKYRPAKVGVKGVGSGEPANVTRVCGNGVENRNNQQQNVGRVNVCSVGTAQRVACGNERVVGTTPQVATNKQHRNRERQQQRQQP